MNHRWEDDCAATVTEMDRSNKTLWASPAMASQASLWYTYPPDPSRGGRPEAVWLWTCADTEDGPPVGERYPPPHLPRDLAAGHRGVHMGAGEVSWLSAPSTRLQYPTVYPIHL